MLAIALALGSSVLWGLSDFLGGLKSRSVPVAVVLATMYATSLLAMAIFVGVRGEAPPSAGAVAIGLGAGLFGIAALTMFYRALAIGTMSVVAPVASTGVALPVLVGLASGDKPGLVGSLGLVGAVIGVMLASRESAPGTPVARAQRASVLLAIGAGFAFGAYFVLAEIASRDDVGWALLLSRLSATPLIVASALVVLHRGGRRLRGRELAAVGVIGLLDLGANVLYNSSTTIGELSTVAVAGSLYPVMTVLLAGVLLGERVRGVQRAGIVLTLVGVALIALGARQG
jgi:drug/metabolite transporter (DMT)-like permease